MKRAILLSVIAALGISAHAQHAWSLRECIDYATAHNVNILQAEITVKQSEVEANTAKWARLPNLNASGSQSFNWGRTQTAVKDPNTGDYITKYVNTNSRGTNMSINSSMPLFTGFELPSQYNLSKLNLKASMADLQKAKEDLAINIASAYLQALFCKELHQVAQGQVALSQEQFNRIEALEKIGKASAAELAEAKARVAQDELDLVQTLNNYRLSILDLTQLIEIETPDDFEVANPDQAFLLNPLTPPEEVYASAMLTKPAVQAAQARLAGSEQSIKIAQSGYYPSVNLNSSMGTNYYSTINRSFRQQLSDNFNRYIGLSLNIPIFNRFATRNRVRSAKLQRENYALQLENTKKTLYKEIQQAWYNATAAQSKYASSEAAANASLASFELTSKKYENGTATAVAYNEAKQNLLRAQSEELQAKYEYIFRTKILDFYKGIEIN
ncbi:MAG: TolC family protein [Bacteroidaceae bacterium]|nr:TolC family protein [Bacteroidaceae bacterium]